MQASDLAGAADDASRSLFCAVPRPEDAVCHAQWRAALRRVEAALEQPGVVAILGPPGTGKTLLLHAVAQRLRAAGRVPVLLQQGLPPDNRGPDVILIDRPDRLPAAMLDALAQHKRPVVLTGRPEMADWLRTARAPVTIVTLAPLARDDAALFLRSQLAQAGEPADLLHPDAVERLIQRSGGVPRALQMLAGLSVFMARLGDADQVTVAHVERAALVQHGTDLDAHEDDAEHELLGDSAPPDPVAPVRPSARTWKPAVLALGALGCAMAAGWAFIPRDRPTPQQQQLASVASAPAPAAQPAIEPYQPAPAPRPVPEQPAAGPAPAPASAPRTMPAPGRPPLPPSVPVHVTVSYPPGDAAAGASAASVAGKLRDLGYQVAPPVPGAARGESAVLYAFAEDEPTAAALARALGIGTAQIRPAALPRPGAIRVLVAPTGAASPRRTLVTFPQTGPNQ